jgi:ribose transport system permease protein
MNDNDARKEAPEKADAEARVSTAPAGGRSATARVLTGRLLRALGPLLALLVVVGVFSLADMAWGDETNFRSARSVRLVGAQSVKIAIASLGMTLIIIAGGIDLSAGTAAALAGCVTAAMLDQGFSIYVAIASAILCGAACGFLNGSLISLLKLVPFIITLGTMTIFLGIGKFVAGEGGTITPPREAVPEWLELMVTVDPDPRWISWPVLPNFAWGIWLVLGLACLVAFVLYRTVFGRYVFAIGSSESTARLCGIAVARNKLLIYTIAGALIGLAGVVDVARMGKGDATAGMGIELEIIAAVVIGGGSLVGGRGSVLGTLCGVLIMGVIAHGCSALGLEEQVENILLGVIIVSAVFIDRIRHQKMTGETG